jgi:hypothetical protein
MRFRFRGKEYDEIEKPTFAELAFIESRFKTDIGELQQFQSMIATFYVSIKRVDPGLLSWDVLMSLTDDDFEVLPEPPEISEPDPAELPKEQWPLDPTGAGTQTAPRPEYVPSRPPTYPSSPYFGDDTSGT